MSGTARLPPIFLDRDGTIVEEVGYLSALEQMRLIPGAADAIRAAKAAGRLVVVITNQSGVARGMFTEEFARRSGGHLRKLLEERGAHIDGYYYCPDHPQGRPPYDRESERRKPRPGMVIQACGELGVSPDGAWMIGDRMSDLETGRELGVRPILVRTGYGRETEPTLPPEFGARGGRVFDDLAAAMAWILAGA